MPTTHQVLENTIRRCRERDIIIPTFNEAGSLGFALKQLMNDIEYLSQVEIIVCDHHRFDEPPAGVRWFLNPLRPDSGYPHEGLCGAAVAQKLLQTTFQLAGRDERPGLDLAAIALAAEQVGGAQRCLDMAVEYAKERVQFGKPIGHFQAIKRKLADMRIFGEAARALVYRIAWCKDQGRPLNHLEAAVAKLFIGDWSLPVTNDAGVFARILKEKWPTLPIEEEGRLNDAHLRVRFIEHVFCRHRWRTLVRRGLSRRSLIAFHTAHKLLLRAHNEAGYRRLGKIVASAGTIPDAARPADCPRPCGWRPSPG